MYFGHKNVFLICSNEDTYVLHYAKMWYELQLESKYSHKKVDILLKRTNVWNIGVLVSLQQLCTLAYI